MFTTMLGSMVISNTAITAMMVAALSPLLHSLGKSGISKAILLGTSISATMGGISTIIGSPPNAIAVGILENTGTRIEFLEWMLYGVPICIVLTVLCYFVLSKVFIKESSSLSFSFLNKEFREESKELVIERNIVLLVLIITVLFWLSSSWHGITIAAVSAIPIVFLTLTGVLKGEDMRALPWDTLFVVAGGLSLGVALESTGILNHYVVKLKSFDLSPFVFILLFSYLSSILSIFMTNAASCAILIPLGLSFLPGFEKVLTLSIGLSASMALILPISPAWNAIIYSTGLLEQRDFKYGGLIVGILGPLFVILWVFLISK
jgi:sodium-dependent dicarboxylate transporter 2/3/5